MKIIAVILLFSFNLSQAKIYKCKQTNGITNYSEKPCPESQKTENIKNFKQLAEEDASTSEKKSKLRFGVPFYPGAVITSNEITQGDDKSKAIRDISFNSYADPKKVLGFYQNHPAIKSCEKNEMADNYICKFTKTEKISSGDVFIDSVKKKGKIEVVMWFGYFK